MNTNIKESNHCEFHNITFTEKSWYEFILDYAKRLPAEVNFFITTTISLWAISEIIMTVTKNRLPIQYFAFPVISLALFVSIYKAILAQNKYIPESLKTESIKIQKIFRKQKWGWQAAIVMQMLLERIEKTEATLERIKRGTEFIQPTKMDYEDYIAWLLLRPEVIRRLEHSVTQICTKDLPMVLATTKSEDDLKSLRNEIEALAKMYEFAKNVELDCHAIIPPEGFEYLHEMTQGWTDTIRSGVHQFVKILDELAHIDGKQLKAGNSTPPTFEITIDAPKNLDAFNKALRKFSVNG